MRIEKFYPYKTLRMDCYHQALLPIFQYYNKSVVPLLLSDYVFYSGENEHIKTYNYKLSCIEDICKDLGLKIKVFSVDEEKFVTTICSILNDNIPVVCYMDSFYNPNYTSIYGKGHSNHCVPIYGYDCETEVFNIIDSDYIEDYKKKETTIKFADLKEAFFSWAKIYNKKNQIIFAIENCGDAINNVNEKYVSQYHDMFQKCENDFILNINKFNSFIEWFSQNYPDEDLMIEKSEELCRRFNEIINSKLREYYSYKDIFENIDPIYMNLEAISEILNYVRAIIYKTKFSRKYKFESFKTCASKLPLIIELEKQQLNLAKQYLTPMNIKG